MALKKKNVFQGFMQDDYVPSGDQQIVKYLLGKGNNLHEVVNPSGAIFLVTMPKKFRQTVWLKKGDLIVVDPITEGKKVLGEIVCVVAAKSVVDLIKSGGWNPIFEMKDEGHEHIDIGAGEGDGNASVGVVKSLEERKINALLEFYGSGVKICAETDCMPPSDEEDSDDEDDDEEEENDQGVSSDLEDQGIDNFDKGCKGEVEVKIGNHSSNQQDISTGNEEDEGYKSRVQFLCSGIVTVTNVVNDISSLNLQNGLQSLDFETEDSSLESQQQNRHQQNDNHNSVHRAANTIRIQVNYPPDSDVGINSISSSNISNQNPNQNMDLTS